jgi:hypothetical protein
MDGWMDEWMDGWTDGWMYGWMVKHVQLTNTGPILATIVITPI